jgi:hypothetical protein
MAEGTIERCVTCPAYEPHGGLLAGKGFCHAHPCDAEGRAGVPEVSDEFYCMEHPANRGLFSSEPRGLSRGVGTA